ncbi:hypothetical protein GCM10020219_017770 [Nonomuraea dietziae]
MLADMYRACDVQIRHANPECRALAGVYYTVVRQWNEDGDLRPRHLTQPGWWPGRSAGPPAIRGAAPDPARIMQGVTTTATAGLSPDRPDRSCAPS